MKYAYFITAIEEKTWDKRTFGFYFDLKEAKEAVMKDLGSMSECKYDYLVIERFNSGIWAICEETYWYFYHDGANKWVKQDKQPDFTLGYVNWAIG